MKNYGNWISLALTGLAVFVAPLAAAPACDADNGGLTLPAGFCAQVVADGLGKQGQLRHVAVMPNGDTYVAMKVVGRGGGTGGIMMLRDANNDGKFEITERFADGDLTGIGIRNGYLYAASFNTVRRWKLTPGTLKPTGAAEVVVDGLPGVPQHGDKGIAFDGKGGMYLNVGAPSNACQKADRQPKSPGQDPCPILEKNAGVWRFDENKLGQKQEDGKRYATGMRQMPAVGWGPKGTGMDALYIAMNSRDQLDVIWPGQFTAQENAERPAEPLWRAVEGSNFGWPYCFWDYTMKKFITMPEYGGDGKKSDRCGSFTPPAAAFPGHWAPVAVAFHDGKGGWPAKYKDGIFIAFHGSWNRAPQQAGYNVTFQPLGKDGKSSGNYEIFANGFTGKATIANPAEAMYRPDGLAEMPDGSMLITDRVMVKK
jgi:glucose/arabinose dehydrogenase